MQSPSLFPVDLARNQRIALPGSDLLERAERKRKREREREREREKDRER